MRNVSAFSLRLPRVTATSCSEPPRLIVIRAVWSGDDSLTRRFSFRTLVTASLSKRRITSSFFKPRLRRTSFNDSVMPTPRT